jgi:hypothetical protein
MQPSPVNTPRTVGALAQVDLGGGSGRCCSDRHPVTATQSEVNSKPRIGIFSETTVSTCEFWVNFVEL